MVKSSQVPFREGTAEIQLNGFKGESFSYQMLRDRHRRKCKSHNLFILSPKLLNPGSFIIIDYELLKVPLNGFRPDIGNFSTSPKMNTLSLENMQYQSIAYFSERPSSSSLEWFFLNLGQFSEMNRIEGLSEGSESVVWLTPSEKSVIESLYSIKMMNGH